MKKLLALAIFVPALALAAPNGLGYGPGAGFGHGPGGFGGFGPYFQPGGCHQVGGMPRQNVCRAGRQLVRAYHVVLQQTRPAIWRAMSNGAYIRVQKLRKFAFEVQMMSSRIRRRVLQPLSMMVPGPVIRGNMQRIEQFGSQGARNAWHAIIHKPPHIWQAWSNANQQRKRLFMLTQRLGSGGGGRF